MICDVMIWREGCECGCQGMTGGNARKVRLKGKMAGEVGRVYVSL